MFFIYGIILGFLAAASVGYNADIRALNWGRLFFTPNKYTASQNAILGRAYSLLEKPEYLFFWQLSIAIVLVLISGLASLLLLNVSILFAFPLGYLFHFLLHIGTKKSPLKRFESLLPGVIAQKVAQHCSFELAKEFLLEMARRPERELKVAACIGAAELNSPWAIAFLEKMQHSNTPIVQNMAISAWKKLRKASENDYCVSLDELEACIAEHSKIVDKRRIMIIDFGVYKHPLKLAEFAIDKAIYAQSRYIKAFPNLYCAKCRQFPASQSYLGWTWYGCRACHAVEHLILDAQWVVGQIGGDEDFSQNGKVVFTQLWDPTLNQVKCADIDRLEIIGGKPINYDWAVNAVLETLQNQGYQFHNFNYFLTNNPKLEANTLRMLNSLVQSAKSWVDPPKA